MAKRILIVEDNPSYCFVNKATLERAGYQVDTAEDGKIAHEKLTSGGYDLILMDAMIPIIDGFSLMQKMKVTPSKMENGPVVVMTSLAETAVADHARQLGAIDCLIKTSLTPDLLVSKVKQYLGENQSVSLPIAPAV